MTTTEAKDMTRDAGEAKVARSNRKIAVACVTMFSAMVGLAYASAPLYDLFCRVTGFGGTPGRVESADGVQVLDREITVRFDANIAPGLPWDFKADTKAVTLKIGEMRTISYRARNVSAEPTVGTATFNVAPAAAGAYFSKIACFCFTQQPLAPGEEIEMGVTFYVDPAIVDDPDINTAKTITLSYTFFPASRPEKPVARALSDLTEASGRQEIAPDSETLSILSSIKSCNLIGECSGAADPAAAPNNL